MKAVIFLPNWVGDAVMATPLLNALRIGLPEGSQLIGVARPLVNDILAGTPWLDRVHVYKPRGRDGFLSRRQVARELRGEKADAAILLPGSLSTALIAMVAGIPKRIGYARDARGWLLTHKLYPPKRNRKWLPIPAVDYYLALAKQLNCPVSDRKMRLSVTTADQQSAANMWQNLGWSAKVPTILINSSGAWGAAKLWPESHVRSLAEKLAHEGLQVLLHCGPAEREAANRVAAECNHRLIGSMGAVEHLPLGLTRGVIDRSSVVVSTDSGPRHIAVALDRPLVSLFGPTDPAWTVTYNIKEVAIEQSLGCRSCWQRTCPLKHHRCMQEIAPSRVFHAVMSQLTETHQRGQASLSPPFNPLRFAAG